MPWISHASSRLKSGALLALAVAALVACGGGGGGGDGGEVASVPTPTPTPTPAPVDPCLDTNSYACKTGATEPLYTFQWALNYLQSWFAGNADADAYGGGIDLNVEPAHLQGIKGQGVNVLVIDSGVDLGHEDLKDNADYGMSWNFVTGGSDPDPRRTAGRVAHGTLVAGMIGAAQNGKGVMGIAPQVKLGGAALILSGNPEAMTVGNFLDSYGGETWSRKAHIINGSFTSGVSPEAYSLTGMPNLAGVQALKKLRDGKGIIFVKAAGNAFESNSGIHCGPLIGAYDCINPANDATALEPNVIVTAALNAKGRATSYSSAGSVLWVTGMSGEFGSGGRYGEASGKAADDGPVIFSTDLRGCAEGYSQTAHPWANTPFMRGQSESKPGVKDNPNCDYGYLNGTSSAAPLISGVVALMLSANPDLTWRDVRDILRLSARAVDKGYEKRTRKNASTGAAAYGAYDARFSLETNSFLNEPSTRNDITPGSTRVPVELGWVTNKAGIIYSNWYGFGVPDAAKAVALAQSYKKNPALGRPASQPIPAFATIPPPSDFQFRYQQVSLLGEAQARADSPQTVDQFQMRLSGENVCLGSFGIAVQSPAGTLSLLKMPLDHFALLDISEFDQYGLGSYAFHGEPAEGVWTFYLVASNPKLDPAKWDGRSQSCAAAGAPVGDRRLTVEARIIAQ